MRTGADQEAVAVMLQMLATHAVNARIILVGVRTLVWAQTLVEEIKIGAMSAAQVLTVTVVLLNQIQ